MTLCPWRKTQDLRPKAHGPWPKAQRILWNFFSNNKSFSLFDFLRFYFWIMMIFLQVYNKIDQVSIEEVDRLAHLPNSIVVRLKIFFSFFFESQRKNFDFFF